MQPLMNEVRAGVPPLTNAQRCHKPQILVLLLQENPVITETSPNPIEFFLNSYTYIYVHMIQVK